MMKTTRTSNNDLYQNNLSNLYEAYYNTPAEKHEAAKSLDKGKRGRSKAGAGTSFSCSVRLYRV